VVALLARLVLSSLSVSAQLGKLLIVDDEAAIRFALAEYFRGSAGPSTPPPRRKRPRRSCPAPPTPW
jgi:hypothetical protein